ncbi:hypothetical protein BLNAU_9055 [Blattamonas nauphoetae]|uniref:Reverse transcriptase domain-containing protein n=1 Tax=Blattamonas nauphoetae TaxID=2049346 RepID=A0ABQ9XX69_9EUKA|nr:hypothetical protein BLNAU_9055 [Blattamonas nauphoetae]
MGTVPSPAEKWVVLGQPASTTEQTQEQTQTVRSVSPTPASMRGLTPAEFRDLQHHQAMVFNAASQAQPESQQQPPVELVAGIENHEERAEDLEQTAKVTRSGKESAEQASPPVGSRRVPHDQIRVISFKKSGSVEDLARSVELMTLKAAEVTRSVNDIRIAHFLALPVLDDADATKRESQERQEKRLEELMEKKEKMTVQRRKLQSVDPLFFDRAPVRALTLRAGGYQTFQGWGAQNQTNFRPAPSELSRKGRVNRDRGAEHLSSPTVLPIRNQHKENINGNERQHSVDCTDCGQSTGRKNQIFQRRLARVWPSGGHSEGNQSRVGEDGPPTAGVTIRVTPECQGDERISGGHSRRTQRGSDQETTNGEVRTWNPTFVVAKSDGGWRRILDCRTLNQNVVPRHFKMESFSTVAQSITQGCWMCSLDLKHAYLHVAIHKRDQPHFGFLHNGRAYIQQTLCFGLTSAPRQFTKLLRPVIAQFRRAFPIVAYLDDFLVIGKSKGESESNALLLRGKLELLGFTINCKKSQLEGQQRIHFLGLEWDSMNMTVKVGKEKRGGRENS